MKDLIITKLNQTIIEMDAFKEFFISLPNGKHRIQVDDLRKRSLPQNAYYWAVVVPMVRAGLYEAGWDHVRDNETAHEELKELFLSKQVVNSKTGKVKNKIGESKKLTIPEFNEYIEAICKWAAEYLDVVIPSPNEELTTFAQYNQWLQEQIVDE